MPEHVSIEDDQIDALGLNVAARAMIDAMTRWEIRVK